MRMGGMQAIKKAQALSFIGSYSDTLCSDHLTELPNSSITLGL